MKKLLLMLLLSGVSVQALEAAGAGGQGGAWAPGYGPLLMSGTVVQQPNEQDLEELWCAVAKGEAQDVQNLLNKITNPQERAVFVQSSHDTARRLTSLHLAARFGHGEVIKILLNAVDNPVERAAFVRKSAEKGLTPLHFACRESHAEVIKILLDAIPEEERLALVNQPNDDGDTPLHNAVSKDFLEGVQLLIPYGALINKQNCMGRTPLSLSLSSFSVDQKLLINEEKMAIVHALLQAGALLNIPDNDGLTTLYYAVGIGNPKIIEMLLTEGACPNFKDPSGKMPLMMALGYRRVEATKLLLKYGADPDQEMPSSVTGVPQATCLWYLLNGDELESSAEALAALLLNYGADPNITVNKTTPLQSAIKMGNTTVARLLLESGAKITPAVEAAAAASPNKFIRRFIENRKRADVVADSKRDDQETKTIEELEAEVLGLTLESTSTKKSNKNTQAKSGKKKQTKKQQSKAAGAPVPDEVAATEPTSDSPRSDEEDGVAYLEMLEPEPTPAAGAAAGSADEEECPRASLYLSRAGVIDFNFLPAGGEEAGNAIAFGPATKHVMHKLCAFDSEEERGLTNFSEKRFDTAGGLLLVAPHIQDKFASLLRTRDGALDQDVVDHLVSTELMLKALRYGSCYLAVDTTAWVAKPYLLVVAPIERTLSAGLSEFASNAKNYLTLCFSIDYKGSINHCYHFCVQNKHPKQTKTEADTAKYKLKPIAAKAKIRKRGAHYKLKLEFVRAEDFRNGAQELRGA